MKTLMILIAILGLSWDNNMTAQDTERNPLSFISEGTAEFAKLKLKDADYIMFNDHCEDGWGAVAVSTLKKVWIKESTSGEGNYNVYIKITRGNGDKLERSINLDWIKLENDEGDWVYLAEMLGIKGDYCRADEYDGE
jgi:hypothetical protein